MRAHELHVFFVELDTIMIGITQYLSDFPGHKEMFFQGMLSNSIPRAYFNFRDDSAIKIYEVYLRPTHHRRPIHEMTSVRFSADKHVQQPTQMDYFGVEFTSFAYVSKCILFLFYCKLYLYDTQDARMQKCIQACYTHTPV